VYAVAALAWLALLWISTTTAAISTSGFAASWADRWSHWLLMVVAMMLPVAAPHVRAVALRSLWSRRQRSAALFVLGYVAVWAVVGAALVATVVGLGVAHHGSHLLPVALLLSAAWQVSVPRRRVFRRCAPLRLGAASGVAADVDCARAGVRSSLRCVVECWPVMLAMALSHSLLLMAGLTVVLLSERMRGANAVRRAGRPLEAWVLVGYAAIALAATTLT
jgi:predicted metal-binding membrane protein